MKEERAGQENKLLRACRKYISLCEKGEAQKVNLDEFKTGISELETDAAVDKMMEIAASKPAPIWPGEDEINEGFENCNFQYGITHRGIWKAAINWLKEIIK